MLALIVAPVGTAPVRLKARSLTGATRGVGPDSAALAVNVRVSVLTTVKVVASSPRTGGGSTTL